MSLHICLIFCQFHLGVAYKNVAYKKTCMHFEKLVYTEIRQRNYITDNDVVFVMIDFTKNLVKMFTSFAEFSS